MKVPKQVAPALWGAAGGAIILAILGFTWFGWVSASTAQARAKDQATAAVVSALTPICVKNFQASPDESKNMAALKKIQYSWDQASFIKKGGWATMPGESAPLDDVASACADKLTQSKVSQK